MTLFNQRYPLRYHISTFDRYCLIIQIISLIPFIYCTNCLFSTFDGYCLIIQIISLIPFIYCTICLFSTFDGYCLIIQIINQIPFIYFAVYARCSKCLSKRASIYLSGACIKSETNYSCTICRCSMNL